MVDIQWLLWKSLIAKISSMVEIQWLLWKSLIAWRSVVEIKWLLLSHWLLKKVIGCSKSNLLIRTVMVSMTVTGR
jgi:hypothetical protein